MPTTQSDYAPARDPWLFLPRPNPAALARLFCFPFAGGSAMIFRDWPAGLPESVEVCAVQLPGRGRRLKEPPFRRMGDLLPVLARALGPYFDKPFAFFGHSMGAAIAFELTRSLRRESITGPHDLFVSGCPAPHLPDRAQRTYDLPEPEFIEKLRQLNGTPREVLDHPEMMGALIDLLRADFELAQTYACAEAPPLACPVTALGGADDRHVAPEDLAAWREQTSAGFSMHVLPGDHFFLMTAAGDLLRIVSEALLRAGRAPGIPRGRTPA